MQLLNILMVKHTMKSYLSEYSIRVSCSISSGSGSGNCVSVFVRMCLCVCMYVCVCVCMCVCASVREHARVYPMYNILLWTHRSKLLIAKTQSLFRQINFPPVTDAEISSVAS